MSIDTTKLDYGAHELVIKAKSSSGDEISEIKRSINIKNYNTRMYIDSPIESSNGNYIIRGWEMSESLNTSIKTFINGEEIQNVVEREYREDVLKAINDCGGRSTNIKPGFIQKLNISSYPDGIYDYRVELYEGENYDVKIDEISTKIKLYDTVVFLGDSITDFYNLSYFYDRPNLINSGISGNTTTDILNDMNNRVYKYNPSKVILLVGINDLQQNVDNDTVVKNINKIIQNIHENLPDTKIYLESIYPINSVNFFSVPTLKNVSIESIKNINAILKENALINNYKYIDVYSSLADNDKFNFSYTYDGLHANGTAYKIITDIINEEVFEKYNAKMYIDNPYQNSTAFGKLNFQGWIMSKYQDVKWEFYIDDNVINNTSVERYEREDVLNAIKGYGGEEFNPTPGIRGQIDISSLPSGKHKFEVIAKTQNNEVLSTSTTEFNIRDYKGKIYIDSNLNTKKKKDFTYFGWTMSEDIADEVEVYIDGNKQEGVVRKEREDVLKAIKEYGGRLTNVTPGFSYNVDVDSLAEGEHTIEIRLISSNEKMISNNIKKFIVNKYDTKMYIDNPSVNEVSKKELYFQGWVMSEDLEGTLKIYIDGTEIDSESIKRYTRDDVLKVIKGYGGEKNLTPGYNGTIDLSNVNDGTHNFEVRYYFSDNSGYYVGLKSNFSLKKYDGILCIDSPIGNQFKSSLFIRGWELSELEDSYIEVYIDITKMNINLYDEKREDVFKVYRDSYGGRNTNETPGFKGTLDISTVTEGRHKLTIKLYSSLGEVLDTRTGDIFVGQIVPKYYMQNDPRWAYNVYGLSTMKGTGCAPTSMAMAFDSILGRTVLPTDVANYLYNYTDQFNRRMKGTSGYGIIYASNYFRVKYTPLHSMEDLKNALSSGKIVFAAMGEGKFATKYYNHAIVLFEYDGLHTLAYDPLDSGKNGVVLIQQVWNERSKDFDDYSGGSDFYSLEGYY